MLSRFRLATRSETLTMRRWWVPVRGCQVQTRRQPELSERDGGAAAAHTGDTHTTCYHATRHSATRYGRRDTHSLEPGVAKRVGGCLRMEPQPGRPPAAAGAPPQSKQQGQSAQHPQQEPPPQRKRTLEVFADEASPQTAVGASGAEGDSRTRSKVICPCP
jgi:hypothetical protein